jgi:hypothetical protein
MGATYPIMAKPSNNLLPSQLVMENTENFYVDLGIDNKNEWKIIKSPLEYTGIKLFLKGNENSEEVIIDIEKSLTSSDFFHIKLYNKIKKFLSSYLTNKYKIDYCSLFVMLSLAGEYQYESIMIDPGLMHSEWLMNFEYFEYHSTAEICVEKFKQKFPKCKRIRLKPFDLDQVLALEDSNDMDKFIKLLNDKGLEILLENELVDI